MLKNASAGEKAGWSNGRTPLFSQKDLLRLVGPLLIEQFLAVTVGMADTMMVSRCGEAAISGVSLVDMINNLIIVLFAAQAPVPRWTRRWSWPQAWALRPATARTISATPS